MKILQKGPERVQKAWGKGKIKETTYRKLRYLIPLNTEQGLMLHNVITGELVLLNEKEEALVNALPEAYASEMDELIEKHYLVPEDFDEYKSVKQLRKFMGTLHRVKGISGYTILPTTNCNARCFYCYEAACEKVNMSEETADKAVKFIIENAKEKKASIQWFGGEPLVGMERIDRILKALKEAGIEYGCSMISNGYLFDEKVVEKAKEEWKLNFIQITLDGTEEVYNRVKDYVAVTGSPYRRVLDNIELLLKKDITVSVRMNLDEHNADDLSALIDELKARFHQYKRFNAYVYVLFDDEGYDPVRHTDESKAYLNRKRYELTQKLIDWVNPGRSGHLPAMDFKCCMADNDGSAIIYPDGSLAKCEHYMDEHLGDVEHGFTDQERLKEWKLVYELDKCKACVLFPKCVKLSNCPSCGECFDTSVQIELDNFKKTMRKVLDEYKEEV